MRLDKYVMENGFSESREKAQQLIEKGAVRVNGKTITKSSFKLSDTDLVEVDKEQLKYLSRGGYKLEKALNEFKIDVKGLRVLDAGSSTGGFTDCLLQQNAALVYAIDVGTNQLHPTLSLNSKVISIENKDIREVQLHEIGDEPVDMIVADLSFISITKVLDVFKMLSKKESSWILLLKPQFETGQKKHYKKGIIRQQSERENILNNVFECLNENQLHIKAITDTSNDKADKNVEYLLWVLQRE